MGHVFSCVVDSQPIYYFQAWNLIHSLIGKADVKAEQIIVNCTPNVDPDLIREIKQLNCHVRFIEPFGDKKYCNKIAQLDQDIFHECDGVFLLDLDMIVLANIDHLYHPNMICGKVVDFPNPDINLLTTIFDLAGFTSHPIICQADCIKEPTFQNNLNGGLYVIPGRLCRQVYEKWKSWAIFLLSNIDLLAAAGKQAHVDQVAFSLASHDLGIHVVNLPREYNYPAHDAIPNRGYPTILHYHRCISESGLIVSTGDNDSQYEDAIADANELISYSLKNKLFSSFHYEETTLTQTTHLTEAS